MTTSSMGQWGVETPPVEIVTLEDVEWQQGWNLYTLGAPDSACRNYHQQQGWWAACEADCEANPVVDLGDVDWDEMEVGA